MSVLSWKEMKRVCRNMESRPVLDVSSVNGVQGSDSCPQSSPSLNLLKEDLCYLSIQNDPLTC